MGLLIHDESISGPLIAKRKEDGLDRYDEMWNGVIDRAPWCLTLYRADADKQTMLTAGISDANQPAWLSSQVVPVKFQLDGRIVRVSDSDGEPLREFQIQAKR